MKNPPRMSQRIPCINHTRRYVCVCTHAENMYVHIHMYMEKMHTIIYVFY